MADSDVSEFHAKTTAEVEAKTCRTCRKSLPLDAFCRSKSDAQGRFSQCKACNRTYDQDRYWADPEAARAKNRARWAAKPEAYRKRAREWYQRNKGREEVLAARKARYQARSEEFRRLAKEQRHARHWVSLISHAAKRAKDKELDFNLTKEWGAALWTGRCAVTGVAFNPARGRLWSPSIDRMIPALGYTQANCRFVLWAVNILKSDGSDAQMYELAGLISEGAHGRK